MRLPDRVGEITLDRDAQPWPYPPLGFVPFAEHAFGNGDFYGLYWPVGREGEEPIVAEMRHDEGTLVPVFSTLDAFLDTVDGLDEGAIPEMPSLSDDPHAPLATLEAARNAMRTGQPETAVTLAERVLRIVPEYGAALALLGSQQMRLGRFDAACETALRMFRAPPCFADPAAEMRLWQRACAQRSVPETLERDPIWLHRTSLSKPLGRGGKDVSACTAFVAVIEAYEAAGEIAHALLTLQTYAELMNGETVSFRERAGFDEAAMHRHAIALSARLPNGPRSLDA